MKKKQEREKRVSNRKQEIQTISRASSLTIKRKQRIDRRRLLLQHRRQPKKEAYEGGIVLECLIEQIEQNHENPTTYFFADDSSMELTVKEAAYVVVKFNELSESNKDGFLDTFGESNTFLKDFIEL